MLYTLTVFEQYVYARSLKEMDHYGKKVWVVLARSEKLTSIPELDGVIRVDDYLQSCALTTDGKSGSKGTIQLIKLPTINNLKTSFKGHFKETF